MRKEYDEIQTFIISGIFVTEQLRAYKRYTLGLAILSCRIFSHRLSVALLEGAQARMLHEGRVFTIRLMASTKVTVLPNQYM